MALKAESLLKAYSLGLFPMADSRAAKKVFWVNPERRGILPLDRFHIPRRLARTVRQDIFRVEINRSFDAVIAACAQPQSGREETWINREIEESYRVLFACGHAHTVEAYQGDVLVGGLYGVSLGAAFFGESMFTRARDASKVALVHLVAHLKLKGFRLLDTQFITDHLRQFGAVEIPRADYLVVLRSTALGLGSFDSEPKSLSGSAALQSISQTS